MTMVPAMASLRLASEVRTRLMTFCNRSTSCCRQMLSGLAPPSFRMLSRTLSGL